MEEWIRRKVGKDLGVRKEIRIELVDKVKGGIGVSVVVEEGGGSGLEKVVVEVEGGVGEVVRRVRLKLEEVVGVCGGKGIDCNGGNGV